LRDHAAAVSAAVFVPPLDSLHARAPQTTSEKSFFALWTDVQRTRNLAPVRGASKTRWRRSRF